MKDRQPVEVLGNGALRYGVYNADGTLNRYEYIKLEDNPSVPGTPINKLTLLTDSTETALWGNAADRTPDSAFKLLSKAALWQGSVGPIPTRTPIALKDIPIGSKVQIPVSGINVDFYVVKHDYPQNGRTLLYRVQTDSTTVAWSTTSDVYAGGELDVMCNTDFINSLSEPIKSAVQAVSIASRGGTILRKGFSLSGTELGYDKVSGNANKYVEGLDLALSPAMLKASADSYWTRSISLTPGMAVEVYFNGTVTVGSRSSTYNMYYRPAFCLSTNFVFFKDSTGAYYIEQDYMPAPTPFATDVLGNIIGKFTSIETGTYIGTGITGTASANKLVFSIDTQFVIVSPQTGGANARWVLFGKYSAITYINQSVNFYWVGNTLNWSGGSTADDRLNSLGVKYSYIAVG